MIEFEQPLNAGDLDVLHNFIGVVFGEIRSEMAGDPGNRAFEGNTLPDSLIFFIRLAARKPDDRLDAVDALNAAGRPAKFRLETLVEIVGVFPHALDIGMNGEDCLGVLGSEITSALRGAGLPEHRPSLRRAEYKRASPTAEKLALVVYFMDLGRIGEHAGYAIGDDGVGSQESQSL